MIKIEYMPAKNALLVVQEHQGALILTKAEAEKLANDLLKAVEPMVDKV